MPIVLLKVTLLLGFALGSLPALRRASSVTRHLICACAMLDRYGRRNENFVLVTERRRP